jgi:zinc protease
MGGLTKEVKKGIEPKSTVRLVIPGKFQYSFDNLYKMNSMMQILNIRLREVIREDKSGVYGIGANVRGDEFPRQEYQISVRFGCNPTRVDELISTVKDVINEVKDKPVSEDNLKKVKELQKREFEKSSKENMFWIGQLYNYYYHNAQDKMEARFKNYLKMVEALSAKDIKDVADKYINMNDMIRIVLYPEK